MKLLQQLERDLLASSNGESFTYTATVDEYKELDLFFRTIQAQISNRGDIDLFQVAHGADVDFTLEYQGEKIEKTPDFFFIPDRLPFPSVALEVGYSETYEHLLHSMDLLLEGSGGHARVVILVKVFPIQRDQTEIESAFVEVHEYDASSGRRKRRGGRKISPFL
ncbi:predicted protein [Aspergillus terreus NIH2624]|uniref:Uncharacterized protein n=1 Tax=Aspergillus terreus (strain NIH 2624 / FGSC A1156) TaxID=341663 RepID=Q0CKG2_ASPTN|nr:uncharacterized protein ATEG_05822 [Aspergillus terreus NIH2624]EAU33583.1 predicted protein [Aspergillus terreus NIH2624]